jgi:hypothetical protein
MSARLSLLLVLATVAAIIAKCCNRRSDALTVAPGQFNEAYSGGGPTGQAHGNTPSELKCYLHTIVRLQS